MNGWYALAAFALAGFVGLGFCILASVPDSEDDDAFDDDGFVASLEAEREAIERDRQILDQIHADLLVHPVFGDAYQQAVIAQFRNELDALPDAQR
jgi:hypothetical protein